MNYRGIQDVAAGSSGGFKAFYNGESGVKTVDFISKAGETVSGLKITSGTIVPIESREVTSAQAGVFGLY